MVVQVLPIPLSLLGMFSTLLLPDLRDVEFPGDGAEVASELPEPALLLPVRLRHLQRNEAFDGFSIGPGEFGAMAGAQDLLVEESAALPQNSVAPEVVREQTLRKWLTPWSHR
jgi:hypothetical protein